MYFFRQIPSYIPFYNGQVLAGNLDIFYLGAPIYFIQNRKKLKNLKIPLLFLGVSVFYSFAQLLIIPRINILKLIINLVKLFLCVCLIFYITNNFYRINFLIISLFCSCLFFAFSIIAFFNKHSFFWTQNDFVNKYSPSRLKLLYLEPSELGYHLIIILIFLFGYLLIIKTRRFKIILCSLIIVDLTVLFLANPLGAISFGAIAFFVMVIFDWINYNTKNKTKIYLILFCVVVLICIYLVISKNSIYMRILDTINGADSSNWYRVDVSLSFLFQSLKDTKGLGIGFGNLRTDNIVSQYSYLGYSTPLASSFPSFIAEAGIFAIIILAILMIALLRSCVRSHSAIKWGLFVFIISYQLFGSHFTSGLNWIIYGIILSDFSENESATTIEKLRKIDKKNVRMC